MRKMIGFTFMTILILIGGCAQRQRAEIHPIQEEQSADISKEKLQDEYKLTDSDFEDFFKDFFSLSEEEILLFNQNPAKVNESYWLNFFKYRERLQELLGKYLSEDTKNQLNRSYIHEKIHLPRKLAVNGYVTLGFAAVEKAEVVATRHLGENMVYEIRVTTKSKVEPEPLFYKKYHWDVEKNYYIKTENQNVNRAGVLDNLYTNEESAYYLYLQGDDVNQEDEIKLVQYYQVEVQPEELKKESTLKIVNVTESAPILRAGLCRQSAANTSFVVRIPFDERVSQADEKSIKNLFVLLMKQSRDFYIYYEKALNSNFDIFKEMWKDPLGVEQIILLEKSSYREAFSALVNPYKDNVLKLDVDTEKIEVVPSFYSTAKQPRYIVTIPVKVLYNNNQTADYYYKYYAGMEKGKIEFISFIKMQKMAA